eukprot:3940677-Rhodomonas_salina.6
MLLPHFVLLPRSTLIAAVLTRGYGATSGAASGDRTRVTLAMLLLGTARKYHSRICASKNVSAVWPIQMASRLSPGKNPLSAYAVAAY